MPTSARWTHDSLGDLRVLITLRDPERVLGGYWELPGGKVEGDESPRDAVVRELREEVGITVEPITELLPIEHTYEHASVRLLPFVCRRLHGKPEPIDVEEVRWVKLTDLSSYDFLEASLPVITELIESLREGAAASPTPCDTMPTDPE